MAAWTYASRNWRRPLVYLALEPDRWNINNQEDKLYQER